MSEVVEWVGFDDDADVGCPRPGQGFDPAVVGPEFDAIDAAIEETERNLKLLRETRDDLATVIRLNVPLNHKIAGQGSNAVVVVDPDRRPAQVVDRHACAAYEEQLLDLDLGELIFVPAKIADFRAKRAQLAAAGIPFDAIAPDPGTGTPRVVVVRS
jgi:hypothetical protein